MLLALAIILPVLFSPHPSAHSRPELLPAYSAIKEIPLPPGYERVPADAHSFTAWLRNRRLRSDNTVYLYNGLVKRNQGAQFAVLDISVGREDLQQCADAVMRLRAEYLYEEQRWKEIVFKDNASHPYSYRHGKDRVAFDRYLRTVFAYCGTASLEKQMRLVSRLQDIQAGDVLIKGGFPGHAVMVMDVAQNGKKEKIYLLAQSYMPAQDIHLLKNPMDPRNSPWYKVAENQDIITPEWVFEHNRLRSW